MGYVKVTRETFNTCNGCGGLTKTVYCTTDGNKHFCSECFDISSDREVPEAAIMDDATMKEMISSMRTDKRYCAWYLMGTKNVQRGKKRWDCDGLIRWDHDRIGRPRFISGEHMSEILHFRKQGMRCISTALSVPELRAASEETVKRYASIADTEIVFLMDCRDPQTTRCLNRMEDFKEIPVVIV